MLAPLAEVAPERVLARSGRTVAERVAELEAAQAAALSDPRFASAGTEHRIHRLESPDAAAVWCAATRAGWRAAGAAESPGSAGGRSLGFVPHDGSPARGAPLARAPRGRGVRRRRRQRLRQPAAVRRPPATWSATPRDFARDAELLAGAGCDMVFTGTLAQFFPGELVDATRLRPERLRDPGPAALGLEGEFRPGHFTGVATIVERLFEVVHPDRAYFGQKDFQQCLVVRDLAARRGAPEVVVCPTAREDDGLARSSRNVLLTPEWRVQAPAVYRALCAARDAWTAGQRDPQALSVRMRAVLEATPLEPEYAEVRDPDAWTAGLPPGPLASAVALVAARAGDVRLIDNLVLG